jgi:DNA-binding MarR family transcriptional regulator
METGNVSPAHLKSHLGFWLRFVSNHVSGAFAAKLAARKIGVPEWAALRELYEGEMAPSLLAQRLTMTRGAVTKLADRLIRRKLVRRRADAADGRAQYLALTPAGRALVPALAALADANDAEFFAFLPRAERAALEKTLKEIVRRRGLTTIPTT